jgi:methionyl-tRNA formyltransferase
VIDGELKESNNMPGIIPPPWRVVIVSVSPADIIAWAEGLLKSRGHRVVGVLTAPGPHIRRDDEYRETMLSARPGLDVIVSNYPKRWAPLVSVWKPDLIVCGGFNWKLPADLLNLPRLGAINFHDALLPKYRGRNASGWALRNGETDFGITIHYMTPELDDGPILTQRPIPITDEDDADTLHDRFFRAAEQAFVDALDRIAADDPGTPQDEDEATYAGGAFEPEWRFIDWSQPARAIHAQVRSWHGARDVPRGAFGHINERQTLITKTRLSQQPSDGATPGTLLQRFENGTLLIQCGDGPLELLGVEQVE